MVTWFQYIKRLVLIAICTVIVFIVWSDKLMGSKRNNPSYTIGEEFREDIAKGRGSDVIQVIEGILDKIIGWMPARIFISLVFGMMLEGFIELFWPSNGIADFVREKLKDIFLWGWDQLADILGDPKEMLINGFVFFLSTLFTLFLACFWAILYAIILIPILVVELIMCIVKTIR